MRKEKKIFRVHHLKLIYSEAHILFTRPIYYNYCHNMLELLYFILVFFSFYFSFYLILFFFYFLDNEETYNYSYIIYYMM